MEQIILSTIIQHVQDNQVIGFRQLGFVKGRSCLTNLFNFYGKVACFVNEGKAVGAIHLDFSKAFGSSHSFIFLEELAVHGLGWHMLYWVKKNWQVGGSQKVVMTGVKFSWRATHKWCPPGLDTGASSV